ncbi:unnamed protein product [Aphanomyces euteiches]
MGGLIKKLFRVGNAKPCVKLLSRVVDRVVDPVQPGKTESSFVVFWDEVTRNVVNTVITGRSVRDTGQLASTGTNRPDLIFIVDSVCVFRGEEKPPGSSIETPLQELVNKLVWTYGEVPYLLGYAAVGYEAALCAITYERGQVHVIKLGDYDLEYLEGRFQWLLAMLTVARLLKSLVSLCPKSARDEYRTIDRENEIKIFLETRRVVKYFSQHTSIKKQTIILNRCTIS